jgi:hypothetical protein
MSKNRRIYKDNRSVKSFFDNLMKSKGKELTCIVCDGKEGIPKKKLLFVCSEKRKNGIWNIYLNEDDIVRLTSNKQNNLIFHFFCVCKECANNDNSVFMGAIKNQLRSILGIRTFINIDDYKK